MADAGDLVWRRNARRPNREHDSLIGEPTRLINRMRGVLLHASASAHPTRAGRGAAREDWRLHKSSRVKSVG
jgi:hypothetical protein